MLDVGMAGKLILRNEIAGHPSGRPQTGPLRITAAASRQHPRRLPRDPPGELAGNRRPLSASIPGRCHGDFSAAGVPASGFPGATGRQRRFFTRAVVA